MPTELEVYTQIYDRLREAKYVGIGSGRTVKNFICHMPTELKQQIVCVPTSHDTKLELIQGGFQVSELLAVPQSLDFVIDGFDAIVDRNVAIKGGGGCMTWEKLVALHASKYYLIGGSKKVNPKEIVIPVEVLPLALNFVSSRIKEKFGYDTTVRMGTGKLGPVVTDFGNWIIDLNVLNHKGEALEEVHRKLKMLTGVVETGIFTLPFDLMIFDS